MPIKQVTCSICGEKINKAQTLSVGGDKRACRTHPEVADQSQTAQQQRREAENRRTEELKNQRRPKPIPESSADLFKPKCFSCRHPGLQRQDFLLEMLKCSERYEMAHGHVANPFNAEETARMYEPLKGERCLHILPFDPKVRLHHSARQAGEMLGYMALCSECCQVHGITIATTPPPSVDPLHLAAAYDLIIKPVIREMVAQEG